MNALSPIGHAALVLASEYGVPVFPGMPRSKTPAVGALRFDGSAWKKDRDNVSTRAVLGGFHRATTHAATIGAWWDRSPDANVAARLGSYLRLCVLEADTDEARDFIESRAIAWPTTWTYAASRGVNRMFVASPDIPERPVWNLWPDRFGQGVEFKSGNGSATVPPSVHPSGHVYAWLDGCAPWQVALAPLPDDVAAEVRRHMIPDIPASARTPRALENSTDFDASRILDALRYLDPDDYVTWRDVGLALKDTGHADARGLWDQWSAESNKFREAEQDRQWRSFGPRRITLGSLFFHAQRAGWSPRRAA